ncbi:MAG: DUF4224 domain-containing protein [Gammaproteobacteria bacterium]
MSIFLSADEIAALTGKRRKSCQIAWLRTSGIPFYVNASGRPVVTCAAYLTGQRPADTLNMAETDIRGGVLHTVNLFSV